MPSLDEATRCPQCNEPGEDRQSVILELGQGTVHFYFCQNKPCEWYNTSWIVQILPDGTIPVRPQGDRYPGDFADKVMTPDQTAMGRRYLEDVLKKDLRGTDLDKGSN